MLSGAAGLPLGGKALLVVMAALVLSAMTGCRSNDLGTPCELIIPVCISEDPADCDDPANIVYEEFSPEDPDLDYLASGVFDCEHFTCVASAGHDGAPYCSRPCLEGADEQCRGGHMDLECRELVLDRDFITDLCEQLGDEECNRIFGDVDDAWYCAPPDP